SRAELTVANGRGLRSRFMAFSRTLVKPAQDTALFTIHQRETMNLQTRSFGQFALVCKDERMGSRGALGGHFWLLIGAIFLGFLGFGSVLPALAPHLHHDLDASDRTVGFVIGTFSVVALCSRPFAGRIADRK